MRVTTAFKRLLRLNGVTSPASSSSATMVSVTVVLRRRRIVCPHCAHKTRFRYDTRPVKSRWRHLHLEVWQVELRASLRRLRCPTHGVVVEAVPFARPGAKLTRDLNDLLAWLATPDGLVRRRPLVACCGAPWDGQASGCSPPR